MGTWSPASSGGSGGTFNGGTITADLVVAPTSTDDPAIEVDAPVGAGMAGMAYLVLKSEAGNALVQITADDTNVIGVSFLETDDFTVTDTTAATRLTIQTNTVLVPSATGSVLLRNSGGGTIVAVTHDSKLGFYGNTPTLQPSVTGALSTVIDPAAKDVLTSLLAASAALGLASDGTT